MITLFLHSIRCCTQAVLYHPSFYQTDTLTNTILITEVVQHELLLRIHMIEIQNQNLSRFIASN